MVSYFQLLIIVLYTLHSRLLSIHTVTQPKANQIISPATMKFSVLFTALFAALVTAQHAKGGGGVSAHGKRQVSN